jgi:hypothetical protein
VQIYFAVYAQIMALLSKKGTFFIKKRFFGSDNANPHWLAFSEWFYIFGVHILFINGYIADNLHFKLFFLKTYSKPTEKSKKY